MLGIRTIPEGNNRKGFSVNACFFEYFTGDRFADGFVMIYIPSGNRPHPFTWIIASLNKKNFVLAPKHTSDTERILSPVNVGTILTGFPGFPPDIFSLKRLS